MFYFLLVNLERMKYQKGSAAKRHQTACPFMMGRMKHDLKKNWEEAAIIIIVSGYNAGDVISELWDIGT